MCAVADNAQRIAQRMRTKILDAPLGSVQGSRRGHKAGFGHGQALVRDVCGSLTDVWQHSVSRCAGKSHRFPASGRARACKSMSASDSVAALPSALRLSDGALRVNRRCARRSCTNSRASCWAKCARVMSMAWAFDGCDGAPFGAATVAGFHVAMPANARFRPGKTRSPARGRASRLRLPEGRAQKSMPPMPPMPPGAPWLCGSSFFGASATMHSVVIIRPAMDAAFCSAERVTLVGSRMPSSTMSP